MKFLVILAVAVSAVSGKYVFDYMKTPLNAAEVAALLANKEGPQWPQLSAVPEGGFDCASKKYPGYYADVSTQCQVFHRCDISGNRTSYLCVNMTVFNQLTLICDYWYNVDCAKSAEVEYLANSRLYTDKALFDSPPADYVAPSQSQESGSGATDAGAAKATAKPAAEKTSAPAKPSSAKPSDGGKQATAAPAKPSTKKGGPIHVGGKSEISLNGRSEEELSAQANASESASSDNGQGSVAADATTAAAAADTTAAADAAADTTNAAAAAADTTTAAAAEA